MRFEVSPGKSGKSLEKLEIRYYVGPDQYGVRGECTGPAPRNSEFLTFPLIFMILLERLQTSKATTCWRLRNAAFCQNVAPMGALYPRLPVGSSSGVVRGDFELVLGPPLIAKLVVLDVKSRIP